MTFKMQTTDMGFLRSEVRKGPIVDGKPYPNYAAAKARLIELGDGACSTPPAQSVGTVGDKVAPQVSVPAPEPEPLESDWLE